MRQGQVVLLGCKGAHKHHIAIEITIATTISFKRKKDAQHLKLNLKRQNIHISFVEYFTLGMQ